MPALVKSIRVFTENTFLEYSVLNILKTFCTYVWFSRKKKLWKKIVLEQSMKYILYLPKSTVIEKKKMIVSKDAKIMSLNSKDYPLNPDK